MGKRTFWSGIIVGAIVGGAASLLNRDARHYVKDLSEQTASKVNHYVSNPTEALDGVKHTVEFITNTVERNSVGAMNTLDQVENTLNKVIKK